MDSIAMAHTLHSSAKMLMLAAVILGPVFQKASKDLRRLC